MADVLLWQRYDNNKMVAMHYYGNVFYIFNSTVIDWTVFYQSLWAWRFGVRYASRKRFFYSPRLPHRLVLWSNQPPPERVLVVLCPGTKLPGCTLSISALSHVHPLPSGDQVWVRDMDWRIIKEFISIGCGYMNSIELIGNWIRP